MSVINTAAFDDQGLSCNQSYPSVLADFSTGEVELYSHPGVLRLVPRTWRGIPVKSISATDPSESDGGVIAPRMLSSFSDVEVLLHNQDRAWSFAPDGSVDREWTFDKETGPVYPDGSGGNCLHRRIQPADLGIRS